MAIADDLDRATDSQWDWVAEQTRTYLASGGTEVHESNGVYTLILATTGRKTGVPRRTCLIYGTSGDDLVVVARPSEPTFGPKWRRSSRCTTSTRRNEPRNPDRPAHPAELTPHVGTVQEGIVAAHQERGLSPVPVSPGSPRRPGRL
ncbi:nitroreductase/quinone reductase family protein [Amycolatopsis mongoliensis]|uniref:Nitroreductase/quinone reductase family protein n=1 Tax=Amycolatopsis mongoliensis TaxID=715475 RepID=A0A9Y2NG41_9PSEU|nr:nitroreductase/quinone reductase family protein [Amycolatopsis sp. 4-36]WIY04411.1 nitroreductase/quinone reductase family protein [Amycolatopsis sp. 4-36]